MSQQSDVSKPHWALSLVGSGILIALLTLALMMGRYAEQVDSIAETIKENGATGKENMRILAQLERGAAVQSEINNMTDDRLARLEGKK